MPNRLANESSPYLLQHQNNPVAWYPWGDEALQKAKREDKPIFLSIGYAACHWCHVMEHESFENDNIASFLNEHFVSIKVDREERPDLDHIYMQAVMALRGGGGGWPLSAFLLPNGEVFFGGTYWPPHSRAGMPGFDHVLNQVRDAYHKRRADVELQANQITHHLKSIGQTEQAATEVDFTRAIEKCVQYLDQSFDSQWGGFGSAPKFPHAMDLQLLLHLAQRSMFDPSDQMQFRKIVNVTLDKMARGGIYDHVGGGFARYSVDAQWLVPHFEKMLYDNGLLIDLYASAYLFDPQEKYAEVVKQSTDYLERDMQHQLGGFFSSEDADSEDEEGTFYVWSIDEINSAFSKDEFEFAKTAFGLTPQGNFEGKNILNLPFTDAQISEQFAIDEQTVAAKRQSIAQKLQQIRIKRTRPGCDDKIIVSWNALAISGLAKSSWVFDDQRALQSAIRCAEFILEYLRMPNGRLFHTWRNGRASLNAYLDDYANLIVALCDLYSATFDEQWIEIASEFAEQMLAHFYDDTSGGFYFTSHDHETLITRTKDYQDSSVPSGNSMATCALVVLARLTGRNEWLDRATETIRSAGTILEKAPMAAAQILIGMWQINTRSIELVFVGFDPVTNRRSIMDLRRKFPVPNAIWLYRSAMPEANAQDGVSTNKSNLLDAHFADRQAIDDQLTLYLCENYTCQAPLVGLDQISTALFEAMNGQH